MLLVSGRVLGFIASTIPGVVNDDFIFSMVFACLFDFQGWIYYNPWKYIWMLNPKIGVGDFTPQNGWLVYFMVPNPMKKWDDLGFFPIIFGNTHIYNK